MSKPHDPRTCLVDPRIPHTDPQPVPPSTPLPGGLIFVPLTAQQLRMISEALGSHAGNLATWRDVHGQRRNQAGYAVFAALQAYVSAFIPQPREEGSPQ